MIHIAKALAKSVGTAAILVVVTTTTAHAELSYVTKAGGPDKSSWVVLFRTGDHANGWVVQKVETSVVIKGKVVRMRPFWEAFRVVNGWATTQDTFSRYDRYVKIDGMKTHAEAWFYGGDLPATFQHIANAGRAKGTYIDPSLQQNGNVVVRDFVADYRW